MQRDNASYLQDLERGTWGDDGTLPPNWEELIDPKTGRQYYVDHNTKTTSWVDPRDIFVKPFDFPSCQGHELPFGWELATDPACGEYYIDHASWTTSLIDPRMNTMNRMHSAGTDAHNAAYSRSKLLEEKLRTAEDELDRLHRELRAVPPLHRESVVLQEQIAAQLDKVIQLQDEIDVCHESLSSSRAGVYAMTATFSPPPPVLRRDLLDNGEQVATNESIDRLLRAQGDNAAVTADKMAELEAKTRRVLRDLERQSMQSTDATKAETEATKAQLETTKAQLSQLERQSSQVLLATEATKTQLLERIEQTEAQKVQLVVRIAELENVQKDNSLSKADLLKRFARQQAAIDELQAKIAANPEYKGVRVWDDDLQDFVMRDPSHAATIKMRELEHELAALKSELSNISRSNSALPREGSLDGGNTSMRSDADLDGGGDAVRPSRKSDMMKAAERMGTEIGRVTAASSDHRGGGADNGYVDIAPTPSDTAGGSITPEKPSVRRGNRASNGSVGQGGWRATPVSQWTPVDVRRWLQSVGEPALAASFGGSVAGSNLVNITDEDLKEFSVEPAAHRVAVLGKIADVLQGTQDEAALDESGGSDFA